MYLSSILLMLFTMTNCTEKITSIQDQDNPLDACPNTPNCERTSKLFSTDSATVLNISDDVLRAMNAVSVEWNEEKKQIHAVFEIPVFGWRDDVHIAVAKNGDKTRLFIRSASREGHWDIWANRIRINKFFRKLNKSITL